MKIAMPRKKKVNDSNEKTCNKDSSQPILVQDVIRLILERLSFVDFYRARCVSSVWYSASKSCIGITNPANPWLILFPNDDEECNNNGSCKLFDPCEEKTYTVRDLAKNRFLANCGSWFLILDHRTDFYLLNLFTRETIPLPSLEAIDGWQMMFERISDSDFLVSLYYEASGRLSCGKSNDIRIGKAVLWVDEETREYLVVWNFDSFFAYHKKGDENKCWKLFKALENQGCVDMVYRESKLYVLSLSQNITVFYFSRGDGDDSPLECASFTPPYSLCLEDLNKIVLTLSGEVLIIENRRLWSFTVYKMDPKSSKWSKIKSLGDEVLLLDLGITVAAKDGFMRNCIYFSRNQFDFENEISLRNDNNRICVYDIKTNREYYQRFPMPFKDSCWFFPTFGGKWYL